MNLLLDTHAFLWFVLDSPQLPDKSRIIIEDHSVTVLVSMASIWEMAIKVSLGKLTLPMSFAQFIPDQLIQNHMLLLPIAIPHVQQVAQIPFHHRDPFDRLLVSQCLVEGMPIISHDVSLDAYGIHRIWKN